MKMKYVFLGIAAISFAISLILFGRLPAEVPIHWSPSGEIDRYGSPYFLLFTASLPFLMYALMEIIPRIDPRRDSYVKHQKIFHIVIFALMIFMMGIHWFSFLAALGYEVELIFFMKIMIGVLFLIIGNYLPRIQHNYTFGIRTPWTLADENAWEKTHRVGGYGFFLLGILSILLALFPHELSFYLFIGLMLLFLAAIVVYSYLAYESNLKRKGG